jgi:hypothetical protein
MLMSLTSTDFDLCAHAIARLGGDQPDDVRASLAWVIRNRLQRLGLCGKRPMPVSHACDEVLQEALGSAEPDAPPEALSAADWCRLYALNCLVWSGNVADQTAGATACHRHDRNPPWARSRLPTALLGSYIFFR